MKNNFKVGYDEVGRGSLFGPIFVAAVVFPSGYQNDKIIDSKKLTAKKREEIFQVIESDAIMILVEQISNTEIDKSNINLLTKNKIVLMFNKINKKFPNSSHKVDYIKVPEIKLIESEIKADQKYVAVSAASIIAKLKRDKFIKELALYYPHYSLETNFGYATKKHLIGLSKHGSTPFHRQKYLKNIKK